MGWTRAAVLASMTVLGWRSGEAEKGTTLDASLRERRTCRISLVSFATEQDGLLADMCGAVFASRDGGLSWEKLGPDSGVVLGQFNHLERMIWFSRDQGVALPYGLPVAFRTEDRGHHFVEIPLPVPQWPYAVAQRANRAWACGSAGKIIVTGDAGKTWRELTTPFSGPRCEQIAFADERRGWVHGDDGATYETDDGGQRWRRLDVDESAAHAAVLSQSAEHSGGVMDVRTDDGFHLELRRGDVVVRKTSVLVRAGAAFAEPALGEQRTHDARYAWSTTHLYSSLDDGVSWFVVSDLDAAPTRLAFLNERDAIVELATGLQRSEDRGRHWSASKNPAWDRAELDEATGKDATRPTACLATATAGRLSLRFGSHGCFHEWEKTVEVRWRAGHATLVREGVATHLPLAQARSLVAEIVGAAARTEVPSRCWSTTSTEAAIEWQCGGGEKQTLDYHASACGGAYTGTSTGGHTAGEYQRASALATIGERALAAAGR